MGLDVYVGPLSRYYSGQWETILQQVGRRSGLTVRVIRPAERKPGFLATLVERFKGRPEPSDPVAVVNTWMASLRQHAGVETTFAWDDAPDGEYFTDKPAWDCYGALVLWAAYDENPPKERLSTATDQWSADTAYAIASTNRSSRYRHLVANTEVWIPSDFDEPFSAPMPAGGPAVIGSSVRLLSELQTLNRRTWQAGGRDIELWRQEGAEYGAPLEKSAKMGFAVFHELASKSVDLRLPMKLDY